MAEPADGFSDEYLYNEIIEWAEEQAKDDNIIGGLPSPKAFLLGGQSGAGKSNLTRFLTKEMEGNVISIDGDSFRPLHPNFEILEAAYAKESVVHTAGFAGAMVEGLVELLSGRRYNLIIEGTLRTAETPTKTAAALKAKGYEAELAVIAVKPEMSYLSTILRYEEMLSERTTPRATPKEHHDEIVAAISENLNTLYKGGAFSNIRIFSRVGAGVGVLYDMEATPGLNPKQAQEDVLFGEWTEQEEVRFVDIFNDILKKMEERNAPAAERAEIMKIKDGFEAKKIETMSKQAARHAA